MELPDGWVTELGLSRTAQLRAMCNGVIPAQATYAVDLLSAIKDSTDPCPERPDVRDEGA